MSPEDQNKAIAEMDEQLYLIVKQGFYYRPNAKGYTSCLSEAWKLPREEAAKYQMYEAHPDVPYSEKVLIEPVPIPAYTEDLNAIRKVIQEQPIAIQKSMRFWIWEMTSQMEILPPASVYCEALLKAWGKWK